MDWTKFILAGKGYLSIAVDLDTGAVVCVVEGRGADRLHKFARRLRPAKAKVQAVAIDMAGILKEKFRWIYRNCLDQESAAAELRDWCDRADVSEVAPVIMTAETIRDTWQDILTYWNTRMSGAFPVYSMPPSQLR